MMYIPSPGVDQLSPRETLFLGAMAAFRGESFGAMAMLKLLFLLQKRLDHDDWNKAFGTSAYAFVRGDYGPYCQDVGQDSERLYEKGFVHRIIPPHYSGTIGGCPMVLSAKGLQYGSSRLELITDKSRSFAFRTADWILAHSFTEIVAAICRAYPEMARPRDDTAFETSIPEND